MKTLTASEIKICQDSLSFYPGFENSLYNAFTWDLQASDDAFKPYLNQQLTRLSCLTGFHLDALSCNLKSILNIESEFLPSEVFWIKTKVRNNCIFTPARFFSQEIEMVFDTGCSFSMINENLIVGKDYKDMGFTSVTIANGQTVQMKCVSGLDFEFGNQKFDDVNFFVTSGPSLLGNNILNRFKSIQIDNINNQIGVL